MSFRLKHPNLTGYAFIAPWLAGFLLFTLVPVCASFFISLTEYDLINSPAFTGLKNYRYLFATDRRFFTSVKVTLLYVITAVPLRLVFVRI